MDGLRFLIDFSMLLVDLEKAYDRVEWDFIIKMLRVFDFPTSFVAMLKFFLLMLQLLLKLMILFLNPFYFLTPLDKDALFLLLFF